MNMQVKIDVSYLEVAVIFFHRIRKFAKNNESESDEEEDKTRFANQLPGLHWLSDLI